MRLLHSDPPCCCNNVIRAPWGPLVCCLSGVLNPSIHGAWLWCGWAHMLSSVTLLQACFRVFLREVLGNRKAAGLRGICDFLVDCAQLGSVQKISGHECDLTTELSGLRLATAKPTPASCSANWTTCFCCIMSWRERVGPWSARNIIAHTPIWPAEDKSFQEMIN